MKSLASFNLKLFKSVTREKSIPENVEPHAIGDQITWLRFGGGAWLPPWQRELGGHMSLGARALAPGHPESGQSGARAAATPTCPPQVSGLEPTCHFPSKLSY